MISLQNNLDPTSSLIGQKLIVYCIAKPVKNLNILGLVLSLFHKSKRLHSPSDNERNNTFEMLEEYEESFEFTRLRLVINIIFSCPPNILHGFLCW